MNDGMNYSWSINLPQSPHPARNKQPQELFAFDRCAEHRLPEGMVLLVGRQSGRQTIVTHDVLYALNMCREFRPLEGHVEHLARTIPELEGQEQDTRRILQSVRDAGLLVSAKELSRSLWDTPHTDMPDDRNPMLFIATCDRPKALKRLLTSIEENCANPKGYRCIVLDDSRSEENQRQNEACVTYFSRTGHLDVRYFGQVLQQRLISLLTGELPELVEEIQFLIDPTPEKNTVTPGRTRNLALILSAGQRSLVLDDDILCQVFDTPSPEPGIEISSRSRQAAFYSENSEWSHFRSSSNPDPLARHAEFLGLNLSQALGKLSPGTPDQQVVRHLQPEEFTSIHGGSKIVATACGYFGDPGTTSNSWIYALQRPSREKLFDSEDKYRHSQHNRNVWLGSPKHHLVTHYTFMSPITGLDHRSLLPPYFPRHRNEDFLFGEMLQFLYPDSILMDFPWAAPHLPIPPRKWERNSIEHPESIGVLFFSGGYISDQKERFHSTEPEARLKFLSVLFLDMATTSEHSIRSLIADRLFRHRSGWITQLDRSLTEAPTAPGYWIEDLKKGIRVNHSALLDYDGDEPLLNDIPAEYGAKREIEYLASSWSLFSRALRAWPAICRAATSPRVRSLIPTGTDASAAEPSIERTLKGPAAT